MKGILLAGGTSSYQFNTETLNTKVSVHQNHYKTFI